MVVGSVRQGVHRKGVGVVTGSGSGRQGGGVAVDNAGRGGQNIGAGVVGNSGRQGGHSERCWYGS